MSARFQKSLLAVLGAAALVHAQDVSLPVIEPTDTGVAPTDLPPSGTVTEPSFTDTVIVSPTTLSLSTDVSITEPTTTETITSDDNFSASLPWITGSTTITTTNQDGESTTDTISGGVSTVSTATTTATTGSDASQSGEPTSITTLTSTSTEGGGGSSDSPTETSSGDESSPSETEPPAAAAPRVEAVGAGFVAIVAGLLAL